MCIDWLINKKQKSQTGPMPFDYFVLPSSMVAINEPEGDLEGKFCYLWQVRRSLRPALLTYIFTTARGVVNDGWLPVVTGDSFRRSGSPD